MNIKEFTIYYSSLVPRPDDSTQWLPFRLGASVEDETVDQIHYYPDQDSIVIQHSDNNIFTFKLDGGSVVGYTIQFFEDDAAELAS